MRMLLHPATVIFAALAAITAACTMAGTENCGTSGENSLALFFASTGVAAAGGLATAVHVHAGSREAWVMGVVLAIVFGGAWFVIGGFVYLIVALNHCPITF